jgi:hypothetical protein
MTKKKARERNPEWHNINVLLDTESYQALSKAVEIEHEKLSTIVRGAIREKLRSLGYLKNPMISRV